MRLYRTKYRDKKTGRTKQVKTYSLEFRDPDPDVGIVHRWSLGIADENKAIEIKAQIARLVNCQTPPKSTPRTDLIDWVRELSPKLRNKIYGVGLLEAEQANTTRPLSEHLADYIADLEINSDSGYPAQVESCIKKIIAGCNIEFWSDVDGVKIRKFLTEKGIGNHTAQHYIAAFKMFANWLKEQGRIKEVPVIKSIRYDVPPQRAFEEDELAALYEATRKGPERYGLTGLQRYALYKLAFDSGLRRKELRSLTVNSFNFGTCTVLLPGTDTKNRSEAFCRITPETAALVKEFTRNKTPDAKMFNIHDHSNMMIRKDAEAAGIETNNWKGKIKFKSIRASLATHLARKGVPMHIVQRIMRHASIKTTARYYLKILGGDTSDAINSLRGFGEKPAKEQTA